MSRWQFRSVPLKFQLSDWTLFSLSIPLQIRAATLIEESPPIEAPTLPTDPLIAGSQGFLIRSQSVAAALPAICRIGGFLCYVPLQYQHCYIDFGISFEVYQKKFSSKTRSTINRKIRKFAEHSGGSVRWQTYASPGEMGEFLQLARSVSKLTYQERLLDAGIPVTEEFARQAELLATEQRVRAYILFDGDRPVAYLYCPVYDNVLIYSYLGYDPAYIHLSVGTVLQWLAVEQMFKEARFRYFDFTEGQSDHKRLFATHQRSSANVFYIRRTLRNTAIVYGQLTMNRFSKWLGGKLDDLGLKTKIRRMLRFGA